MILYGTNYKCHDVTQARGCENDKNNRNVAA